MICDQCFTRHTKCPREKPNCSRCVRLGIVCSYDRPSINFSRKKYDNVAITLKESKYKQQRTKKTPTKHIIQFKNENIYDSLQTESKFQQNWSHTIKKWTKTKISRGIFDVLTKACGISLNKITNDEKKFLIEIFLHKMSPDTTKEEVALQFTYFYYEHSNLLALAIKAYFYYVNPFYPLFTYNEFIEKPRSINLVLSICCTGLQFLPSSSHRDLLIDSLEKVLLPRLVYSKLSYTLDTVQVILTFLIGLKWRTKNLRIYSILFLAKSILTSLGFDNESKKQLPGHQNFEPTLAFRVMNCLDGLIYLQGPHGIPAFSMNQEESKLCYKYFDNSLIVKYGIHKKEFKFSDLTQVHNSKRKQEMISKAEEIVHLILSELSSSSLNIIKVAYTCLQSDASVQDKIKAVLAAEKKVSVIFKRHWETVREFIIVINGLASKNSILNVESSNSVISPSYLSAIFHSRKADTFFLFIQLLDNLRKFSISDWYQAPKPYNQIYFYQMISTYCMSLISLLAQVNPSSPFIIYRDYYLLVASRTLFQVITSRSYQKHNSNPLPPSSQYALFEFIRNQFFCLTKVDYFSLSAVSHLQLFLALSRELKK